jgi:hypothetical protein
MKLLYAAVLAVAGLRTIGADTQELVSALCCPRCLFSTCRLLCPASLSHHDDYWKYQSPL